MYRAVGGFAARILIVWFPFFMAASVFGQEADSALKEPSFAPEAVVPATAAASAVPDAVLEGIQVFERANPRRAAATSPLPATLFSVTSRQAISMK